MPFETLADTYLTPTQAARRLDISAEWVRRMAKAGLLPALSTPLGLLFPSDAVERLREQRELRTTRDRMAIS